MTRLVLTPALCRAAGADAANRRMRAAGRAAWDAGDYDAAAETCLRLSVLVGFVPPDAPQPSDGTPASTLDGDHHA